MYSYIYIYIYNVHCPSGIYYSCRKQHNSTNTNSNDTNKDETTNNYKIFRNIV